MAGGRLSSAAAIRRRGIRSTSERFPRRRIYSVAFHSLPRNAAAEDSRPPSTDGIPSHSEIAMFCDFSPCTCGYTRAAGVQPQVRGGNIKIYSIIVRTPPNYGGRAAVLSRRDTSEGDPINFRKIPAPPNLFRGFPFSSSAMRRLRTAALPKSEENGIGSFQNSPHLWVQPRRRKIAHRTAGTGSEDSVSGLEPAAAESQWY